MYLHCIVPDFEAAVHQAVEPALRGRPVAVAADASPRAPLLAVSREARRCGLHPGWRAGPARRRCAELALRVVDPDLSRRAQRATVEVWAEYAPRVAGDGGRVDVDLAGTEALWGCMLLPGRRVDDPRAQARLIARRCQAACRGRLRLACSVGGGARLLVARCCARLAASRRQPWLIPGGDEEWELVDPLPLDWLASLDGDARRVLRDCGLRTIADVRRLGDDGLGAILGADGRRLAAALAGADGEEVPVLVDGQPRLVAQRDCGAAGADPATAARLCAVLARELGFRLRRDGRAAARLALTVRWLDGRAARRARDLAPAAHHDEELAAAARALLARVPARRVHFARLRLVARRLVAPQEQAVLFDPARRRRLEAARDRLRRRYGRDLVRVADVAGDTGGSTEDAERDA